MAMCPRWLRIAASNSGVKYSAKVLATKMTVATAGCAMTWRYLLFSIAVSHSRGPRSPRIRAGLSARSASVTGAPTTRKIGVSMFSTMCCAMCTLNRIGAYLATPVWVTATMVRSPRNQETVRAVDQESPRLRSRTTAAR